MNIAIIGAGTIGAEVYKQALRQNWTIQYIVRRDGIYRNLKDKIDELANLARQNKVDLVFVAVPSNKQTSSYRYFHMYLQRGIPIVTAEKSALAHYFFKLRPYLDKIGYSATVGGGSRMIQYLESFPQQQIKTVQAVFYF
jgi:homoserine dehydrogenase